MDASSYWPPGPVGLEFLKSDAFVSGIMGPIGSGKSTACIMKALTVMGRQNKQRDGKRRSRGAIIRNSYPELRTTSMNSWFDWVPKAVGSWQDEGPPTHRIQGADGLDAEVLFLALDRDDDVRKLLSLELTWAWVNEAREVPKAIVDALTGRVGRYPAMREGGPVGPCIMLDTNAPDDQHWWYVLAEGDTSTEAGAQMLESTLAAEEELRRKGLLGPQQSLFRFFKQPGARTAQAENVKNLVPGYYERAMAGKDADYIRVYIDAEYGFVREGKPVYSEYRDSLHCKPFELNPRWPLAVGLDFGLTPAAVVGQRTPMGQWRVREELVCEDMGATRFGEQLARLLRRNYPQSDGWKIASITGDPSGNTRSQTDEETVFDLLAAAQIKAKPAETNDFTLRRDAVGGALSRLIDGEPGLVIHPECRVLRKGMAGAYCLRRLKIANKDLYRDVPDKTPWSHVCEALQYLMIGGGEGRRLVAVTPSKRRSDVAESDYRVFGS